MLCYIKEVPVLNHTLGDGKSAVPSPGLFCLITLIFHNILPFSFCAHIFSGL